MLGIARQGCPDVSSTNLFGTFLDEYAKSTAERKAGTTSSTFSTVPLAPVPAAPGVAPAAQAAPDPVDQVMKALRDGPREAKDLLPFVGNSAGQLLRVVGTITGAGWAATDETNRLALTADGRQIADLIV